MTKNKITEGNAFALNIRQAVWRTLGGVIQPLLASELVDVHLYVGSGTSKSTATEYPVTADGDTISAVMPATLKRGVYKTWLTAIYNGREVASNCDAAFEIVAFDEHYQAYAPERVDSPMAVYLQPADVTDAELEQLKAEFRAKNAALDAAKAEAEQARQEYIAKAEELESVATSEQVVALGALTSEEILRVKELIGTPAEGQADTLFAAIREPNIDVAKGKQELADALNEKGVSVTAEDTLSTMARGVKSLDMYSLILGGTEWDNDLKTTKAGDVIGNMLHLTSFSTDVEIIERDFFFYQNQYIKSAFFEKLVKVTGSSFMKNASFLDNVSLPNLSFISGADFLFGCNKIETLSLPNLVTVNAAYFVNNMNSLKSVYLPNLSLISGCRSFRNVALLEEINIPNLIKVYNSFVTNAPSLKRVVLPNVSYIDTEFLHSSESIEYIELGVLMDRTANVVQYSKNKLKKVVIGQDTNVNIMMRYWGNNSTFNTNVSDDEFNANFREGIIERVYDRSGLNAPNTITLGKYAFEKLTEETIAMATAKGWNIAQA